MGEIKNFTELIEPKLQVKDKSIKVLSYSATNLVPVGDNYGSVILAIELNLNNGEKKHLVAKLNPPAEVFKKIFNISIAFRKEAEFYSIIVPALHTFQKNNHIEILDSFASSYGHRFSLSSEKDAFDEDACFVMENMKFGGFIGTKRSEHFDLSTTVYILKTLAHFHALPIAMKIKEPEVFNKIKSHLPLNFTDPDICAEHAFHCYKLVKQLILKDPEIAKYASRVDKLWQHSVNEYIKMNVLGSELFNTITHNDMWLTNIMLKFDDAKKPIGNKLVDYQMAAYGNPANDVLFFIHTSVQADVITKHYENLIDVYFEEFINQLESYKINTKPFTKETFLTEVDSAAKCMKLYHICFMLVTVFMEIKKDGNSESILKDDLASSVSDGFAKQLKVTVLNWVKHDWL